MAEKNNDRAVPNKNTSKIPKPEIEIIVDGNSLYKPGMKTFFVEDMSSAGSASGDVPGADEFAGTIQTTTTMGEYCTCNTVLIANPDYNAIGGTMCACDSHCTCQSVSTCPTYTTYSPYTTPTCPVNNTGSSGGGGGTVSCNGPCACVPVH